MTPAHLPEAAFLVPGEDFDFEGWAHQYGLDATVEPQAEGGFLLKVYGEEPAIDAFEADLGWDREEN